MEGFSRLVVAVEHILHAAPGERHPVLLAILGHRVVTGVGGRCHHHLIDQLCPAGARQHPGQDRLVSQGLEHLSGQAAGGHSGLNDRNDFRCFVH
jgi:hypothetical protein